MNHLDTLNSMDMSNTHKMTESLPVRSKLEEAEQFQLNIEKFNQLFETESKFWQEASDKLSDEYYEKLIENEIVK